MNSSMPAAATSPSRGRGGGPPSAATACSASQRWMAASTARRRSHQATRRSPVLEKVHVPEPGSAEPRTSRAWSRLARYQRGSSAGSAGAGSRVRRLTRSLDVTTAAIHRRMPPMWRTRSAASHWGQCGTFRSQSDRAAASRERASPAAVPSRTAASTRQSLAGMHTGDAPRPWSTSGTPNVSRAASRSDIRREAPGPARPFSASRTARLGDFSVLFLGAGRCDCRWRSSRPEQTSPLDGR